MSSLLIVGGGKMGGALLGGLLRRAGSMRRDVAVIEPAAARRAALEDGVPRPAHPLRHPRRASSPPMASGCPAPVLATKPDAAEGACRVLGVSG